jgi:hypothetical protein
MTALDRYLQELARIQSVSRGGSSNPMNRIDLQQGMVVGVHLGGVDVVIRGDLEPVPRIRYLTSYTPGFGDLVWLLTWGTDRLVLGDLTTLPTAGSTTSTIEDWHEIGSTGNPAFLNSWVNWGGGFTTAAFAMQSDGWVRLKGVIKNGSGPSTNMFILPVGYRPPFLWGGLTLGNDANCAINIQASGAVNAVQGGSTSYTSLDGLTFPTLAAWERERDTHWFPFARSPSGWIADASDINLFPLIYRRADGWRYLKGNFENGAIGGAGFDVYMPVNEEDAVAYSEIFCAREDGVGMIRVNLNGSHGNFHRLTKVGKTVMVGLNYWSRRGENFFSVDPTFPHKSMQSWTYVLSFLNGWSQYLADPQYRNLSYMKDDFGIVHIRGISDGAGRTGDIVTNLPAGFRPGAKYIFPAVRGDLGAGGGVQGRVNVYPNGDLEAQGSAALFHQFSCAYKAEA